MFNFFKKSQLQIIDDFINGHTDGGVRWAGDYWEDDDSPRECLAEILEANTNEDWVNLLNLSKTKSSHWNHCLLCALTEEMNPKNLEQALLMFFYCDDEVSTEAVESLIDPSVISFLKNYDFESSFEQEMNNSNFVTKVEYIRERVSKGY